MRVVLDTSAYSAFNRGDVRMRPWFAADYELLLPLIVLGELRSGFAVGNKRQENENLLARFLDSPSVEPLVLSDLTTIIFADVYRHLRQKGRPIGTNDMWIAALAIECGEPLLTLDKDFSVVPMLKLAAV